MIFIRQGDKLVRTKDLRCDTYRPLTFSDEPPNPQRERCYQEHFERIRADLKEGRTTRKRDEGRGTIDE